jgi:hypothetical protein
MAQTMSAETVLQHVTHRIAFSEYYAEEFAKVGRQMLAATIDMPEFIAAVSRLRALLQCYDEAEQEGRLHG